MESALWQNVDSLLCCCFLADIPSHVLDTSDAADEELFNEEAEMMDAEDSGVETGSKLSIASSQNNRTPRVSGQSASAAIGRYEADVNEDHSSGDEYVPNDEATSTDTESGSEDEGPLFSDKTDPQQAYLNQKEDAWAMEDHLDKSRLDFESPINDDDQSGM